MISIRKYLIYIEKIIYSKQNIFVGRFPSNKSCEKYLVSLNNFLILPNNLIFSFQNNRKYRAFYDEVRTICMGADNDMKDIQFKKLPNIEDPEGLVAKVKTNE